MTRVETVSIIYQHPRILLGMKKVRFGKGKYNGFGGGIEIWENPRGSAIRETFDETGKGIIILDPIKFGEILFHFQGSEEQNHVVHFFRVTQYIGQPRESEEMRPEWFNVNEIPYDKMWNDDRYWLPLLLNGVRFRGRFEFGLDGKIVKQELNEVPLIR